MENVLFEYFFPGGYLKEKGTTSMSKIIKQKHYDKYYSNVCINTTVYTTVYYSPQKHYVITIVYTTVVFYYSIYTIVNCKYYSIIVMSKTLQQIPQISLYFLQKHYNALTKKDCSQSAVQLQYTVV